MCEGYVLLEKKIQQLVLAWALLKFEVDQKQPHWLAPKHEERAERKSLW